MLRTVADQPSLWEAILPEGFRRLPAELARIDVLLDDPVFFAPFVPFFDESLPINRVTLEAHDPFSKQPDYKKCAVRLKRLA